MLKIMQYAEEKGLEKGMEIGLEKGRGKGKLSVNLGDHLPVPVVKFASDHPGKQFIVTLSGFF